MHIPTKHSVLMTKPLRYNPCLLIFESYGGYFDLYGNDTYKVLPALRLRVPDVQLFSDEHLNDSREDGVAEDEAEDGEHHPAEDEADAALGAPIHPEPSSQDKLC